MGYRLNYRPILHNGFEQIQQAIFNNRAEALKNEILGSYRKIPKEAFELNYPTKPVWNGY